MTKAFMTRRLPVLGVFLALLWAGFSSAAATFTVSDSAFLLDGKPFLIKAGEMHPARVPHEYWADRLRMLHAMGLNTVSIYVFWNQHEPREGKFNFSGDADIAQFVRLAQKEGLWVIVRPGPYCCAEWEFGGYPWWLLKQHDLKVRSQDPRFLAATARYLKKLGEQLAPLQVTRGGPIIMVQVENEYGSYGSDHVYMGKIRDQERAAGFDVPLFTSDGGGNMMAGGSLPDVLPGLNGGGGSSIFKEIGKYRPNGPFFVPEFYPGWLDHWGEKHAHVGIPGLVRETEWKLTNNVSFCYYMVYGGTSFGFMSGANYGGHFQPQPTSYDYDSPMDEMGRPTPKFFALREVLARHLAPGEKLPDAPAATPLVEIPNIELKESASLLDNLGRAVKSERPLSFEDIDQGYGYVLYRTKLSGPVDDMLKIKDLRDYAVVMLDGKRVAALDRRHKQDSTPLKSTGPSATLDILVENGGRINYGGQLPNNRKGITESVKLGERELTGWEMYRFPFDRASSFKFKTGAAVAAPAVHRGTFNVSKPGDTFLDMRGWGKGIVLVNGHNLGRYWHIGPQQTLYLPGVWLKKGRNEIVVFEQLKDGVQPLAGLTNAILNQLNPDENAPAPRPNMKAPKLDAAALVKEGSLAAGTAEQTISFPATKARYVCLQALSSHNGDEFTTLAELNALDSVGKILPRKGWKVLYVDSEENFAEGDQAEKAIDGDSESFWHSLWSAPHTGHPHTLVVDLGAEQELSGLRVLPRQDSPNGRIKAFRLYLSVAPFSTAAQAAGAATPSTVPASSTSQSEASCAQPSPEEMAKAAGVRLPHLPWHTANIWWEFERPVAHFESLEVDVTIDRDVPSTYNLYVSPCGRAEINGQDFYGGLQSNINGWQNATNHTRVHPGKGAIFSRWSSDKKTPVGLENVKVAGPDCLVESAGYEGEFASVRRPFAWTKGTYTYQILKAQTEVTQGRTNTWYTCRVKDAAGKIHEIGSLRFEGDDFTYWAKHSAFVEVYSTEKIPHSGIPKVNVTFSWPRLNGQKVPLKAVRAYYPSKTGPASPDCAWIKADGENVRVELGPIFVRDEKQRRHEVPLTKKET